MKEWIKAELTELELKCTESGTDVTPYKDDSYIESDDKVWYSFSSTTD